MPLLPNNRPKVAPQRPIQPCVLRSQATVIVLGEGLCWPAATDEGSRGFKPRSMGA